MQSKYKAEFDSMLIEHMRHGSSYWSFGALVSCGRQTLDDWCEAHPSFKRARGIGEVLCLDYWEKLGMGGITGQIKNFQPAVYIYMMKCRFRRFGYGLDSAPPGSVPGDENTEADNLETAKLLKIVRG